jgi:DNA segregation ATPase FtsK/SpoIIIE, S-DNA-T family
MAGAAQARRLASPAIRDLAARRLAELGGFAVAVLGLALLVALATYNPNDPSLDTATTLRTSNLAGPAGAVVSDLLLQFFGMAGVLPGLALLGWGWRIGSHRPLRPGLRLTTLILGLPVIAALLAGLPDLPPWPTAAGAGGAIGRLIAAPVLEAARGVLGPLGVLLAGLLALAVGIALALLTLGLSAGDWRAAGQGTIGAARRSYDQGRRTAGFFRRTGGAVGATLGPVLRFAGRSIDPDANAPQPGPPLPKRDPRPVVAPRTAPIRAVPPMDAEDDEEAALPPTPRSVAPVAAPPVRAKVSASKSKAATPRQESLPLSEGSFRLPPLSLLKPAPARQATGMSEESLQLNAKLLESVLDDYGVQGQIREIRPGPVVTLYELEPAPGIRSARVIGLADDVARSLSVTAVRIATVPGRNVIGIEVPNAKRETVFLSELIGSEEWDKQQSRLTLALGKEISGSPVVADLARMPHLLVAGTTGSGKSVGINAMILSLLYRLTPDQCRLILIDPKMLELSVYDGIPHLMAPVVTEPAKAVTALKWTVREMERRYRSMSQLSVRNIGGYNERVADARAKGEVVTRRVQTGFDSETGKPIFEEQPLALEPLPFIVVVIDEMADLMMVAGKEIEAAVQRLAQMARAAGIHVVMATQRPSVDVITGTIKANFPTRISFQVISKFDSRTILGEQGAEQLLGQGDMLYMQGGGRITRVHGPFVSDREVEDVVAHLRAQGEPAYLEEVTEPEDDDGSNPALSGIAAASDGEKGLFDQAVAIVAREGKASTSFIQRHLQIGYNRAAKLIEQMEKEGIVGPANHVGKREVLVRRSED